VHDNYAKLAAMNTKYDVMHYINDIRHKIAPAYDGDEILCQQYAWWILQALCEMTKTELIMHDTVMLSHEQQEQLDQWIYQLVAEKKPLQYILGFVPFAGCDILVEPPILIPRPETEEWCLHIIEHLQLLHNKKIKILDLATGSGCIAIALGYHLPLAEIVAIDISDAALALTEKNIEHHKMLNITCIKSDLFTSIPRGTLFDIIVSNPPYISQAEFAHVEPSVTNWEDHNALVATEDGLAIIKQIIAQAPQFIQSNNEFKKQNIPQLVIEIGYAQGAAVRNLMNAAGYNNVLVHKDLEGKDRFVTGRVDNVANAHTRT
jgi:release factor glutamine methyltransferase